MAPEKLNCTAVGESTTNNRRGRIDHKYAPWADRQEIIAVGGRPLRRQPSAPNALGSRRRLNSQRRADCADIIFDGASNAPTQFYTARRLHRYHLLRRVERVPLIFNGAPNAPASPSTARRTRRHNFHWRAERAGLIFIGAPNAPTQFSLAR